MRYQGTIIRPPSEARSYILQVTYGCFHNRCTFCGTYLDKPFRIRPVDQVLEDIRLAQLQIPGVRRVFLADGNALVLDAQRLLTILEALAAAFPALERVGAYANVRDLKKKNDADLASLRGRCLGIIYLGLESGSDQVLQSVRKGAAAGEMVQAVQKARAAGILTSIIGILGLAGPDLSAEHAQATGKIVSEMDPDYFSMLTLLLDPKTELYQQWQDGDFQLMEPEAMLRELRQVIYNLDGLSHCVFRTNHASNYLPLAGTLPGDKEKLLATLDMASNEGRPRLRPEFYRAL